MVEKVAISTLILQPGRLRGKRVLSQNSGDPALTIMKPITIQLHRPALQPISWPLLGTHGSCLKPLHLTLILITSITLYCSYYPDHCALYHWSFWERAYSVQPIRDLNLVSCFAWALKAGKWTSSSIFQVAQLVIPATPAPRTRELRHISAEGTMRSFIVTLASSYQDTEAPRNLIFYPMSHSELAE